MASHHGCASGKKETRTETMTTSTLTGTYSAVVNELQEANAKHVESTARITEINTQIKEENTFMHDAKSRIAEQEEQSTTEEEEEIRKMNAAYEKSKKKLKAKFAKERKIVKSSITQEHDKSAKEVREMKEEKEGWEKRQKAAQMILDRIIHGRSVEERQMPMGRVGTPLPSVDRSVQRVETSLNRVERIGEMEQWMTARREQERWERNQSTLVTGLDALLTGGAKLLGGLMGVGAQHAERLWKGR